MKTIRNLFAFATIALAVMLAVPSDRIARAEQAQLVTQFPTTYEQAPSQSADWLKSFMLSAIQDSYVRQVDELEWNLLAQITSEDMTLEALRKDLAVFLAILDSHSALYPPEEAEQFFGSTASEVSGIGIIIGPHEDDWKTEREALKGFYKENPEMRLFTEEDVARFMKKYKPLNLLSEEEARQFIHDRKMDNALTEEETKELWHLGDILSTVGEHGLIVAQVMPGSPAELAGIQNGFLISAVDGKKVSGMKLDDVVALVRGKEGTFVTVTIVNTNDGMSADMVIERAPIEPRYVGERYLGNGVGYIKIDSFFGYAAEQFYDTLAQLEAEGMTKLVIDVRGNGGGELQIVETMLNMITPPSTPLLLFHVRGILSNTFWSEPTAKMFTGPIAVLVNRNSASASEILAGALKDNKLAIVVGELSYGKGTVQGVSPLQDGSVLLLTIATFELPSGQVIEGVGILPDIQISDDPATSEDEVVGAAIRALTK